jgi:hypothetical protein
MNTFDYLDVKIEISSTLDLIGFYYMLNPPGSADAISEPDHGYGNIVKIDILDSARQSAMGAVGLILATSALAWY